jgi:hypothetical protein
MKAEGLRRTDSFFALHYVSNRRVCVERLAAAGPNLTVHFQRTFALDAVAPGTRLRLRLPLPLAETATPAIRVVPDPTPPDVLVQINQGRLEARFVHDGRPEVTFGATLHLGATETTASAEPSSPPDPMYLAPREGLIVVTDRIRRLAHELAPAGTPPLAAMRAFWDYLFAHHTCGTIHYDQVDPAAPGDWMLDSGWFDCQLASSLLVALCRARGIPARLNAGNFLYPSTPANHFWLEIWLEDGGWTPFDTFSWDLAGGGRDPAWRDRFFARLEPRLTTERLPRECVGPIGIPLPRQWLMMQFGARAGLEIVFSDIAGKRFYADRLQVVPTPAKT